MIKRLQKFDKAAKAAVTGVAVLGACLSIAASYLTLSASGTTSAAVIIPPDPLRQARVTSFIASSDGAASTATIYQGTAAFAVKFANTNLVTTNMVLYPTNGVVAGSLVLVQGAATNKVLTVAAVTSTNLVLAGDTNYVSCLQVSFTAAPGFAQVTNQNAELLSAVATLGLGSNAYKNLSGDYALNPGRGGYVVVTGTAACSIDALTVKYEASSAMLDEKGCQPALAELTVDGVRYPVYARDEFLIDRF